MDFCPELIYIIPLKRFYEYTKNIYNNNKFHQMLNDTFIQVPLSGINVVFHKLTV